MLNLSKILRMNLLAIICFTLIVSSSYSQEGDFKPVAFENFSSSGLSWTAKISFAQLELTISRPDGTVYKKTFGAGSSPYVGLASIMGESYMDGSYTYQLLVIPQTPKKFRKSDGDQLGLRGENTPRNTKGLTQTGSFLVSGGAIVIPNQTEAPSLASSVSSGPGGLSGTMDQVILDDLIVIGSLCVGQDCANGESFGFDTLRLKENNLRIRFYDTSNSGSFPSNDWQITANDSSNGGANKFSIDDIDGGRTPFTIEASAPSNSLYIEDSGQVGFGTATPVADIHVVNGNTPTLRLEQNGSSGFTPQTWDVSGNEANFFIRDATNGSTLPIRLRPGAPTSAIDIAASGRIGLGTSSPSYPIHLLTGSGTNAIVTAQRSDGATVKMGAVSNQGQFGTISDHPLKLVTANTTRMTLSSDNSLEMESGATCTTTGVWTDNSSRELKENIKDLTTEEAMEALEGLTPVRYNYKVDKDDDYVGFIAEDVPELVATKDRKHMSSMDVVAVLTKVVKEQQKAFKEQQKIILELKKEIEKLKKNK